MKSYVRHLFAAVGTGAAAAALLLLSAPVAAQAEEAATAPPEAAIETAATEAPQVYQANGVTITWNLGAQRYEAPSAELAEKIAEDLRARLAERKEGRVAGILAPAGEVETRVLANGTVQGRLSADLLSASVVRVDADGALVGQSCVEGVDAIASALTDSENK